MMLRNFKHCLFEVHFFDMNIFLQIIFVWYKVQIKQENTHFEKNSVVTEKQISGGLIYGL